INVAKLVRELGRRKELSTDRIRSVVRREGIHHRIVDRIRVSPIDIVAECDGCTYKLSRIVPEIPVGSGAFPFLARYLDREDKFLIIGVRIPLNTAELGRSELFFPPIESFFVFVGNIEANTAVGWRRNDL